MCPRPEWAKHLTPHKEMIMCHQTILFLDSFRCITWVKVTHVKKWVRAVGVIAATWNDLGMTQFLGKTLETLASKFRIQDYPGSSCEWIWILDLMATVPTIFQLTIDSLEWFSVHVASPLRRFAPQMLVLTNLPRLLLSKPEIWWQLIKAFQTALIKAQSGQYDVICTLSECFQNDSTY